MAIQYKTTLDHTFHALGDETRRDILSMLAAQGPRSASELHAPFEVAQPTVSKHLKVLEKAGLVEREINGRSHVFKIKTAAMSEAQEWISRHKQFWAGTLKQLDTYIEKNAPREEDE
ncbi:MAG: metalloregulator ArsR/SmtB family transcription factor [Emcibacteraceae bacterium]|nr:metalloregulator ArsR/SmtB family transcription factor [Emcibacteraceae bacterium]